MRDHPCVPHAVSRPAHLTTSRETDTPANQYVTCVPLVCNLHTSTYPHIVLRCAFLSLRPRDMLTLSQAVVRAQVLDMAGAGGGGAAAANATSGTAVLDAINAAHVSRACARRACACFIPYVLYMQHDCPGGLSITIAACIRGLCACLGGAMATRTG